MFLYQLIRLSLLTGFLLKVLDTLGYVHLHQCRPLGWPAIYLLLIRVSELVVESVGFECRFGKIAMYSILAFVHNV